MGPRRLVGGLALGLLAFLAACRPSPLAAPPAPL
jgi:hypothetical protein